MRESRFWIAVFTSVMLVGIVAIALEFPLGIDAILRDGYRLLSIFLGVLAGVALGEHFKIRNDSKAGAALYRDLVEELRVNQELLEKRVPLRKGFWIMGIRSGIARHLPGDSRRDLWDIYSNITHYNEEFQLLHSRKLVEPELSVGGGLQNEVDELRNLIGDLIGRFLRNAEPDTYGVRIPINENT
jgi:hypothetical protein